MRERERSLLALEGYDRRGGLLHPQRGVLAGEEEPLPVPELGEVVGLDGVQGEVGVVVWLQLPGERVRPSKVFLVLTGIPLEGPRDCTWEGGLPSGAGARCQ